jgi:hypothetical protein
VVLPDSAGSGQPRDTFRYTLQTPTPAADIVLIGWARALGLPAESSLVHGLVQWPATDPQWPEYSYEWFGRIVTPPLDPRRLYLDLTDTTNTPLVAVERWLERVAYQRRPPFAQRWLIPADGYITGIFGTTGPDGRRLPDADLLRVHRGFDLMDDVAALHRGRRSESQAAARAKLLEAAHRAMQRYEIDPSQLTRPLVAQELNRSAPPGKSPRADDAWTRAGWRLADLKRALVDEPIALT